MARSTGCDDQRDARIDAAFADDAVVAGVAATVVAVILSPAAAR